MGNPVLRKTWVVPADLKSIDQVCNDLQHWFTEQDLQAHLFVIEILVRESLNNAVIHGCNLDPSLQVHCEIQITENEICIKVADDGVGFNWRQIFSQGMVINKEVHGRGLWLYYAYADFIGFNPCGSSVILVRNLKTSGLSKDPSVSPLNFDRWSSETLL